MIIYWQLVIINNLLKQTEQSDLGLFCLHMSNLSEQFGSGTTIISNIQTGKVHQDQTVSEGWCRHYIVEFGIHG